MKGHSTLLLLILCTTSGFAQHILIKDDRDEHVFMPYDLTFLVDSTNNLTIDDVASERFSSAFVRHPNYQNTDFQTNASYWIRLSMTLDPESEKIWLLEFYDQTIDQIDAYIPTNEGHD